MSSKKNLFDDFAPVSRSEWEDKIAGDLRGADYKQQLQWETGEGIDMLPFYRQDDFDSMPAPLEDVHSDWEIREFISEKDPAKANLLALEALENGADAISFSVHLARTKGAMGYTIRGTAIEDQQAMHTLLNGVPLSSRAIHLQVTAGAPIILAMLANTAERTLQKTTPLRGTVAGDPFALAMTQGALPVSYNQLIAQQQQMVQFAARECPNMRCLAVDARPYHRMGATMVQELGLAMASGSEYLATVAEDTPDTATVARHMHFSFAIGSNYLLEIARFRAARKLWANVLEAYGAEEERMYLHAATSPWNKTIYEPYGNMLRSSTENMSAALAGCDAITVSPFDSTFRQADAFSRRMARNTQIILKEEAFFNKVRDPGAGSYFIEKATDKIAAAAWSFFQEIEQQGGMMKALQNGYPQAEISAAREKRDHAIATGERIFIGINAFPKPDDHYPDTHADTPATTIPPTDGTSVEVEEDILLASAQRALRNGAGWGDLLPAFTESLPTSIETLPTYRGAQAFEALRKATEAQEKQPLVLTLPMGDKKMRKARSSFATNFFGTIGYSIEDPLGYASTDEAMEAVKTHAPDIVVLCSADEAYPELVPHFCRALKERDHEKSPIVVLAGYPKKHIESFKEAGVEFFIHAKSNMLETLEEFQRRLNVI